MSSVRGRMKSLEPSLTSHWRRRRVATSPGSEWRIVSVQSGAQRGSEWFPVRSLGTSEDSGAHLPSDIGDTHWAQSVAGFGGNRSQWQQLWHQAAACRWFTALLIQTIEPDWSYQLHIEPLNTLCSDTISLLRWLFHWAPDKMFAHMSQSDEMTNMNF